jgi:hypothetical protein
MKKETIPSQDKIILDTLKASPGVPISMPALAALSRSFNIHTRAHAINDANGKIVWNIKRKHGRNWNSYYYFRPLSDPNKEPEFIPA